MRVSLVLIVLVTLLSASGVAAPPEVKMPQVIGHRGLPHDAPENTLAGFSACLDLRIGFELDLRRSKDGQLVCVHDDSVDRTTDGKGKVADLSLADLRKLDAGSWLHPAFAGERVPSFSDVLMSLRNRSYDKGPILLDLKVNDAKLPRELTSYTTLHSASKYCVCIGETITDAKLRKALRAQSKDIGRAVLAEKADDLEAALKDSPANWVYVRFIPTTEQVAQSHKAGKKVLVVGKLVMGREPENWNKAKDAGVDALLTDHPLECRQLWRKPQSP